MSAVVHERSNSDAEVEAICNDIRRSLQAGTGSSFDSLQAHARVGQGLIDLKEHLPHGRFGREVETRFGLKKQWRARLMKLATEWADVLTAIEWAKATGQITRSEYSVDGALSLVATWHRQKDGTDDSAVPNSSSSATAPNSPTDTGEPIDLLQLLRFLWAELVRARAHICFLQSEIERLSESRTVNLPTIVSLQ